MLRIRRSTTMNMTACVGYRNTPTDHRLSNSDTLTRRVDQTFFDGKNYRWIIQCLIDGYGVSVDLIEYMEDYCNLLKGWIRQLNTYSNKWRSKLHSRSSLSSYNTTKLAQIQTVSSPDTLAQLIQTRCDAIQQVINSYKRQVDRMYPKERLGFVHKHYQSDNMEELFKDAYSDRQKVFEKLQKLQNDEKDAQEAVREAKAKCQNLELNETTSKSELSKGHDRLEKKEAKLQAIQTRITRTEDEYRQAQETYRRKATGIYQQCRELEEERLNQIRETLIAFNRAIHSTDYSNKQNGMYENLLATIESGQKTVVDLDFWAQTYHVNTLSRSISSETNENDENSESQKPKKSHKNETTSLTTIVENTIEPIAETEEDQSVADKPTTTQGKGKQRKKKNNTPEPTTPDQV